MAKRQTPLFDRTAKEVLRDGKTLAEVMAGLSDARLREHERIHLIVLGSSEDISGVVATRPRVGLKQLSKHRNLSLFSYERSFGRKRRHRVRGEFLTVRPNDAEPVSYIIAVDTPEFLRSGVLPLIESLYPQISRPFLTQRELFEILQDLKKAVAPDALRIQEYSARRRLRKPARKKFESFRDWTDVDIETAFEEAAERNVWFRSVKFEAVRRKGLEESGRWAGMSGRLSKYGHVSINGGLELVEAVVAQRLASLTVQRTRMFSNRERSETPNNAARPLELTYERDVFRTPDDIKRLLEGLRRFPNGSCTVLHGNPYLHAALVDNLDFSAADVWVLSQQRILIVPQMRASNAALKRMVNHIFENFAEGRIGEAKIG
jgi:hypothetical protein